MYGVEKKAAPYVCRRNEDKGGKIKTAFKTVYVVKKNAVFIVIYASMNSIAL